MSVILDLVSKTEKVMLLVQMSEQDLLLEVFAAIAILQFRDQLLEDLSENGFTVVLLFRSNIILA